MFSYRYIDKVQQLTKSMNSRINRSINTCPKDVNYSNQQDVVRFIKNKRKLEQLNTQKIDIKVGDYVRVSINKKDSMEKGYTPNYSDAIYKVVKINTTEKWPMYKLEDFEGYEIHGGFYRYEIQKVKNSSETVYRIDKILAHRTRNGYKEVFVKWKNFADKHNSWILASSIETSSK